MIRNFNGLLKQLFKNSCFVIVIGIVLLKFFRINRYYSYVFILGYVVSIFNFIVSATITKYSIESNKNFKGIILMISFSVRIIIISLIGLFLVLKNNYYIIPYILGYMFNFISLFMAIKSEEERK